MRLKGRPLAMVMFEKFGQHQRLDEFGPEFLNPLMFKSMPKRAELLQNALAVLFEKAGALNSTYSDRSSGLRRS